MKNSKKSSNVNLSNTIKETWKNIPNFQGKYQVSNMGRVRSLNHSTLNVITSCNGTTFQCYKNYKGRVLKASQDNYGYFHVRLYKEGVGASLFKVHKLVAMMFLDNFNNSLTVDHINGNKADNSVSNLQMMSLRDNVLAGKQRNNHTLPEYKTSIGDSFKKLKNWCKRHGFQYNKYQFYKSIYSGLPYMNTGITFEKV